MDQHNSFDFWGTDIHNWGAWKLQIHQNLLAPNSLVPIYKHKSCDGPMTLGIGFSLQQNPEQDKAHIENVWNSGSFREVLVQLNGPFQPSSLDKMLPLKFIETYWSTTALQLLTGDRSDTATVQCPAAWHSHFCFFDSCHLLNHFLQTQHNPNKATAVPASKLPKTSI